MAVLKGLSLKDIGSVYWKRISATSALVLVENLFIVLIPLLMGNAIDDLLAGGMTQAFLLGGALLGWTVVSMLRRLYDTRAYGGIRVVLGTHLHEHGKDKSVSVMNARLEMGRELADFFEAHVPEVLTSGVQIIATLCILLVFDWRLATSAAAVTVGMCVVYLLMHERFYRLNAGLNGQAERQVGILETGSTPRLARHLRSLRNWEVRLSDAEAYLYGIVFTLISVFIMYNLWLSSTLEGMTVGRLFSVLTYSWEYAEASIVLPVVWQNLSRLGEITSRIGGGSNNEAPFTGEALEDNSC